MAAPQAPQARVSYADALATLHAMFPAVQPDVVAMVLELNHGAMEPTVEQLLGLDPTQAPQPQPPQPLPQPPRLPPAAAVPPSSSYAAAQAQPAASATRKRWRHSLPDDFLALPPDVLALAGGQVAPGGGRAGPAPSAAQQLDTDAAMAAMLQNEVFLEQLRADPEFAAFLRENPQSAQQLGFTPQMLASLPPTRASQPQGPPLTAQQALHEERVRATATTARTATFSSGRPQAAATSSGSGSGSAAVGDWNAGVSGVSSALQGMTSDIRRRFDLISARFRRSAGGGAVAAPPAPVAPGGARGFMQTFFDGRGAYSSVPTYTSADVGTSGGGGGGGREDFTDHPRAGGSPGLTGAGGPTNRPGSAGPGAGGAGRAGRVHMMGASPQLLAHGGGAGAGAGAAGMTEIELGGRSSTPPLHQQPRFDVEDEDDESEGAGLTAAGKRRV